MGTFTGAPMAASSGLSTRVPAETTKSYPGSSFIKQVSQSIPVNQHSGPPPGLHPGMLKTSTLESMSFATPEPNRASAIVSESSTLMASDPQPPLSTTINHYGDDGPDGPWTQKHSSHAPIYAAASILPIVVLVMVGAVFCICLRRRKQRRKENSALPTQEMKQSKHTVLTHVAPPARGQSPSLSGRPSPPSPPSQLQPVILGPILSSSNGAYMTGMDTSDVVSIRAHDYADTSSLTEPPPPYRPSSIAPPSFVSTSRPSSLRVQDRPPTTSRTHLMERSPFHDPFDDVSEVSGPARGQGDDTLSVVSDMSYQHDPVVTRSAL